MRFGRLHIQLGVASQFWNGQELYGYSTLYNSHSACFMAPLLKEAPVGTSWSTMHPWQGYSTDREIIVSDTSMVVRGVNYTHVIGVADRAIQWFEK